MKAIYNSQELRAALMSLMKANKLKQKDVVRFVGISQAVLSNFVRGIRNLNCDSTLKIANFIRLKEASPIEPNWHEPWVNG